ncbi:MAG: GFA family protein [Moorea sp. SIO1F2]|nr:GFA family protein [Moorena sp. SIO3I7]NEO09425.1 GFA family protein [Moorena sp. SIO3I8]NEO23424.1 GFA family protein [Moorena sp. SIO4A5]NEP25810.1 GFA family protein [Moorena sp. SIO3I6]NEQ59218.1 GFA family protein [Moorena sp. SIO4A1]NET82669.1 GFA family protein [Moorena sp. SIO1F2]
MPVVGKRLWEKKPVSLFESIFLFMKKSNEPITYEGGCHCGAVRFRVIVKKHEAIDCNCSMCKKKGILHLIVSPEQFSLLKGDQVLTSYTFNTHTAKHTFCQICGIHPFYRPRSHPNGISVNLRCLDGDVLSRFTLVPFDGANWEENVDKIRK